jgi:enoyl-CoA hydratase/carnithine racemase
MRRPRAALALGKALYYRQLEAPLARAYDDATRTIAANLDMEVAREGIDAFLEKRAPHWNP